MCGSSCSALTTPSIVRPLFLQPVRIEYAGASYRAVTSEVPDFHSVEARHLIMMLRCGSQSWRSERRQGGQAARKTAAKRVKFLLNTFLVVCAESSLLCLCFSLVCNPSSEFEFVSDVAFGLLQAISRATQLLPVWLHDHKHDVRCSELHRGRCDSTSPLEKEPFAACSREKQLRAAARR